MQNSLDRARRDSNAAASPSPGTKAFEAVQKRKLSTMGPPAARVTASKPKVRIHVCVCVMSWSLSLPQPRLFLLYRLIGVSWAMACDARYLRLVDATL